MQKGQSQMKIDDELFWDEIDEEEFEQCILKENEFLTQNPSHQIKPNNDTYSIKENAASRSWIKNDFCEAVSTITNRDKNNINHAKNKSLSGVLNKELPQWEKDKKSVNSQNLIFSHQKKNFYKPLDIGPSSSSSSSTTPSSALYNNVNWSKPSTSKEENSDNSHDITSVKIQLEQVLKEKAKLEDENLIKQGEVFNLRCELKRKEATYESERIDQCMAIEAAEKRGKDKALKNVTDTDMKVKSLEREVERLQGELLFKTREVDELVIRCKNFDQKRGNTFQERRNGALGFPSPKKRKIDHISPTKSFIDSERFDFKDKKPSKTTFTQTENENEPRKRVFLKVPSQRGVTSGSRKTYYLLSHSKKCRSNLLSNEEDSKDSESDLVGQLIFSDSSTLGSERLEDKLVAQTSSGLEKLLEKLGKESPSAWRNNDQMKMEENVSASMLSSVKVLNTVQSAVGDVALNAVGVLAQIIRFYLKDKEKNEEALKESLRSLSCQLRTCSTLPNELCYVLSDTLRGFGNSLPPQITCDFIKALNSLVDFENFRKVMCSDTNEKCLLTTISNLVRPSRKRNWDHETCNNFISFFGMLLRASSPILSSSNCSCSSSLLSTFVTLLHILSSSAEDSVDWQSVFNGVKALSLWKNGNKAKWSKVSQLNVFTTFMSTIIRAADHLKTKEILDQHTWELIYEIYEFDESP